jgi:transposase
MSYIRGEDRYQGALFPVTLDELIPEDHLVRFIEAYVSSLDLAVLGFARAQATVMGRPAYDPTDLLKLYLYGYLNQVRSSRRLERECQRNVEVMWLLGRLAPDFKTIADFRRDNGPAFVAVCAHFVQFCRAEQLLSGTCVAVDGSKFQAVASKRKATTRAQLKRQQAKVAEKIAEYLEILETANRE